MDQYIDTADVTAWDDLMQTGLFREITTNLFRAARAGSKYPEIDSGGRAGLTTLVILQQQEKIKRKTLGTRRLLHRKSAA